MSTTTPKAPLWTAAHEAQAVQRAHEIIATERLDHRHVQLSERVAARSELETRQLFAWILDLGLDDDGAWPARIDVELRLVHALVEASELRAALVAGLRAEADRQNDLSIRNAGPGGNAEVRSSARRSSETLRQIANRYERVEKKSASTLLSVQLRRARLPFLVARQRSDGLDGWALCSSSEEADAINAWAAREGIHVKARGGSAEELADWQRFHEDLAQGDGDR